MKKRFLARLSVYAITFLVITGIFVSCSSPYKVKRKPAKFKKGFSIHLKKSDCGCH